MSQDVIEIAHRAQSRIKALGDEVEEAGWRARWKDLNQYLLTGRGSYLEARDYEPRRATKVNSNINNGTPEEAIHTSSAGMMGGFTSPSSPWVILAMEDPELSKFKPVAEWLWDVQVRMYDVFARSNWYSVLPTMYEEITAFGTAAMRIDPHDDRTIHCTQHTIGSFYLANAVDGFVDTVVYRWPMTVRTAERLYGLDKLSQGTRELFEHEEFDKWVKIQNIVELNEGRDKKFLDWRGMKYRSITMEEEAEKDQAPLKMGGMELFPTVTPRTARRADQVYGTSRGMRALPNARKLQLLEMRGSEALTKLLRPTLNVPSNMMRATVAAGQLNVYRGTRSDVVRPTYTVDNFPYAATQDAIAKLENDLKDTLGASVHTPFATLDATGNHQMTIPEVAERRNEGLILLGPTHHSVHTELLHPAVGLIWEHMNLAGLIPPPPPDVVGKKLKPEFTSELALSARSRVSAGTVSLLNLAADLEENGYEGARDNFNVDAAMHGITPGFLAPPDVLRDEDARDEMRRERAAAIQEQIQAEQDAMSAKAGRDLAASPLGDGNALEAVAGV